MPRTLSVIYGLGGLPLRGADLIELCTGAHAVEKAQVYLGLAFSRRQASTPSARCCWTVCAVNTLTSSGSGLTGAAKSPDLRPPDALTLAVHRISGQPGDGLSVEIASLLQAVTEGQLRSHPALTAEPWGGYCIDRLTCASGDLRDPGAQMPVDLSVLLADATTRPTEALAELRDDGLLLLEDAGPGTELPAELLAGLRQGKISLYRIAALESAVGRCGTPAPCPRRLSAGRHFRCLAGCRTAGSETPPPAEHPGTGPAIPARSAAQGASESFRAGLERVHRLDSGPIKASPVPAGSDEQEAPLAVRRLSSIDEAYDSLPRFWDQVGVLYRNGEPGELTPGPPPRDRRDAAAFIRLHRPQLRSEDASDPGPRAVRRLRRLLEPMPGRGRRRRSPDPRSLCSTRPSGAQALMRCARWPPNWLPGSSACAAPRMPTRQDFGDLSERGLGHGCRKKCRCRPSAGQACRSALEKLHETIGCLPVVATEPFFSGQPVRPKGDAELLFLAINPDACKGCGICISACEPGALTSTPQTRKTLNDAREHLAGLGTTAGHSDRHPGQDRNDPRLGPLAAPLLTRRHTGSLAGGDAAEPGSGARLALRLAMAVAESRQRPAIDAFVREVRASRENISA